MTAMNLTAPVALAVLMALAPCARGEDDADLELDDVGGIELNEGERLVVVIALGYGETQGHERKTKPVEKLCEVPGEMPDWFRRGMEAAQLAPTAVNQQKFHFEYVGFDGEGKKPKVLARKGTSLVGYTQMDLGIAKLHFEIAAGTDNFDWL